MRSHVTRSRASAVLFALSLVIPTACENEPATVGDPTSATTSARTETAPAANAPAAPGSAAPVSEPMAKKVADPSPSSVPEPPKAAPVAAPATEIAWSKGTLEEALEQARKQDKLVFIDFWTTWCGWCKKLDHDTYTDPKVIAAMNEHFVCLSIDAESKTGLPLARRYSVTGFPTLLFLTPDGQVRERAVGYKPPEKFLPVALQTLKPR